MSAQTCPTCGARPGNPCRDGRYTLSREHVSRVTLEFGDWTEKFDRLYRDSTLRFRCRPYV